MRARIFLVLFLLVLIGLNGCAHQTGISPDALIIAPNPESEFAQFVGEAPIGTQRMFSSTPYGSAATVIPGIRYMSGLGQECRLATVVETKRQFTICVCQDAEVWSAAPLIFEPTPR